MMNEDTYHGKHLKSSIGCSSCSIRGHCTDLSWRRDLSQVSLGVGVRGSIACIRLHSAHAPQDLKEES